MTLLERLLEIREIALLLDEIRRGAQSLGRARRAEIVLTRSFRRELWGLDKPLQADSALDSLRGERWVFEERTRGIRILFPVQDQGKLLAGLRLSWRHKPCNETLERLQYYLSRAALSLTRSVEEQRLVQETQRYRHVLEHLPDACVLMLDRHGIVQGLQGEAQDLLGSTSHDLLGHPLIAGTGEPGVLLLSPGRFRQLLASASRHGRAEMEARIQGVGREVQVQLTVVNLAPSGEKVCVLRDLTEVKAMESALLKRNEDLSKAAERLKEIDMLKNEFLSNVSHELRTPLTAIIAYTEALQLTRPDHTTLESFLGVIAEQGKKLQRLISGLLDIAKLDSLGTELKLQPGSLNEVVESAVVTVKPTADKKDIKIILDLTDQLPSIYLDELRSQQIVWNLLNNAIKFSPRHSTVRVTTWSQEGKVWASVTDEGMGIAPEHQKLIFEKFVQVDGSSTRRHGGVGLGLDLVKHLVELHGGSIEVRSEPGKGATFAFWIPIEKRRKPREVGALQPEGTVSHRSRS